MKRWLTHPALVEMYPGLLALAVIAFGLWEGWGGK
jgi:hypothetical protein